MVTGNLSASRLKIGLLIRRGGYLLLKGGEKMSKAVDMCVETAEKVINGEIPLDPAGTVQDLIHSAAMKEFAEDRTARRIGDNKVAEEVNRAQEMLKK